MTTDRYGRQQAPAPAVQLQSSANRAMSSAGRSAANMSRSAGQLQDMSGTMWNDYQSTFAPVAQQLAGSAQMPLSQYTNQAAGDVSKAFDRSRGMRERDMQRMGINPNSGRWQGSQNEMALLEAAARAGAITGARNYGREANFSRMMQVAGLGQNTAGQAIGAAGAAGQLHSGAAGVNMGIAGMYGNAASQAAAYNNYQPPELPQAVEYQGAPQYPGAQAMNQQPAVDFGNYMQPGGGGGYQGGYVPATGQRVTSSKDAPKWDDDWLD